MIPDVIVSALLGAISALTSLLPSFTLPTTEGSGAGSVTSYSWLFNRMVPLHYFVTLMALTLAINLALVVFDMGVWIWHQIHGSD